MKPTITKTVNILLSITFVLFLIVIACLPLSYFAIKPVKKGVYTWNKKTFPSLAERKDCSSGNWLPSR